MLGHSRLIWARFVTHQNLPTVLRCHIAAFEAIGGAGTLIIVSDSGPAFGGDATFKDRDPQSTKSDPYDVNHYAGSIRFP